MRSASAVLCVSLLLAMLSSGCFSQSDTKNHSSGKLPVLVSIEPLAFMAERIGKDKVHIEVLVPPGTEPETYMPTPERISAIARSELFFRIGFPSEESFLPKLGTVAPELKVVDVREGIPLLKMECHSHGPLGHSHEHGADDPHVWLSPTAMKKVAENMTAAMCEADPDNAATYRENAKTLIADLESVRVKLAEKLESHKGETIYVFHPAYGYFCDEFGLKQKAIEMEGRSPAPQDLADWIAEAQTAKVRKIIVQPEFNQTPAKRIAEAIGGTVVVHSTLGRDYLNEIEKLAEMITTE